MKAGRYRFSESFERQLTNLLSGRRGDGTAYKDFKPTPPTPPWWSEPVSDAQLAKLTQLGFSSTRPKTKGEASKIISELVRMRK